MRRLALFLVLAATLGVAGRAAADLPPLIDRELFFGDPEISGAQLSPDGHYISFIKPYKDTRNIWVKGLADSFGAARPLTADSRPVVGYFWSVDGKYVLYVQDKGGNENWHVYAVDPSAAPDGATGVPPARDLTPVEGARASIYSVPDDHPDEILVGLNDRDPQFSDVYRVVISTGERTLVRKNDDKVGGWFFDRNGNLRLAYRQKEDGGGELLSVNGTELKRIYESSYLESAAPVGFTKDGGEAWLSSNVGDQVDRSQLLLMDVVTGKTKFVEEDPEHQVDVDDAIFDEETHELMATVYVGDTQRIYPKTERARQDYQLFTKELPPGNISMRSSTKDMHYSLVTVTSDVEPGVTYLYDRRKGTFTEQFRIRPELNRDWLAPMKPIRYKARDGMEIPAYLTLPKGVPAKNLPLVMHPHGGPWARDEWSYSPYPQFLANRGYAVIQPNFRSSSGYGKKFLNAGNHQWGTGAMQDDLTDGVNYLIAQGIVDPKRVAIFGGSYGGYATLCGVTFTPELYSCGIPYVAPSNLITLMESFPAYWRPFLKGSWYLRVGDPADPTDRADLEKRSPLNYIDRINVPLLVLHGQNDPRVKRAESDAIVAALYKKGRDVEYIVAPDEGHGFRAPMNNLAVAVAMERFLAKHLGGRAQEAVPAELAAHLAAITVDPASVHAPEAAGAEAGAQAATQAGAAGAATAALPVGDGTLVKPATLKYGLAMEASGRKMAMKVSRVIEAGTRNGKPTWKVTDTAVMPQGSSTDTFEVDRATLMPLACEASGMGTMKLEYTDTAIKGEMVGGGQTIPVDVKLDAPVLGNGPGLEIALAGLPLAPGYESDYRSFDLISQKVRRMHLKVTGAGTDSTAAGTFEVLNVELSSLDGEEGGTGRLTVMKKAPHHVVKSLYKLPAMMGGGSVGAELQEAH